MNTLTKGQTVVVDMTGMGHTVLGTYEGPHRNGGHKVRVHGGKITRVQQTPTPADK